MRRIISIIIVSFFILFLSLTFIFFPSEAERETKIAETPRIDLKADSSKPFPIKNDEIPVPVLGEKAGIAVLFREDGEKILYQKNIDEKLPIASLTKVMSGMVVVDNYPLEKEAKISKEAIDVETDIGKLVLDERISILDLLNLSLLVSSNDAAAALSEVIGKDKFVNLMNEKAKEIGIPNTYFVNPHGLDENNHNNNLSTAYEFAKMTNYSILNYPQIWDILRAKEMDVFGKDSFDKKINHHLRNSLLLHSDGKAFLDDPSFLGGKTGYTGDALDTIILAIKPKQDIKENLIIVLLGVEVGERVSKGKILYDWLKEAYIW